MIYHEKKIQIGKYQKKFVLKQYFTQKIFFHIKKQVKKVFFKVCVQFDWTKKKIFFHLVWKRIYFFGAILAFLFPVSFCLYVVNDFTPSFAFFPSFFSSQN